MSKYNAQFLFENKTVDLKNQNFAKNKFDIEIVIEIDFDSLSNNLISFKFIFEKLIKCL